VTLTLRIAAGARPGEPSRQVFTEEGGTIGRAGTNSLVLTHNKVSGRHAVISFRNGDFYIQDMSRNGVAINSPENRLVRERQYPLKHGDFILIEPYELEVAIESGAAPRPPMRQPLTDPFAQDDPFASGFQSQIGRDLVPRQGLESGEVDPLKFFDPLDKPAKSRPRDLPPRPAEDWHEAHFTPPVARPDPAFVKSDSGVIPQGYNPLEDAGRSSPPVRRPRPGQDAPVARPIEPLPRPVDPRPVVEPPRPVVDMERPVVEPAPPRATPEPAPVRPRPKTVAPPAPLPVPAAESPVVPEPPPVAAPAPMARPAVPPASGEPGTGGLADVLRGAGLPDAAVTPELAQNFGEIIRVVVSGLMDVLQARQRIKEEFRMRQTIFMPAENNPLKFSANVEDALHNLLVKRNPAYLGPVEAFADAFADLRNHQLAMLAGMRVAFEAMLGEFDADRLQEEFDRQLAKVGLPLVPAKMRYWELYREKRRDMAKDPEATFARLFGEEFARAYEEQFRELRAQWRSRGRERSTDPSPRSD
jgi:type VI secretion system FHA domain protein